jgi:hypothetical protein
MFIMNIIALCAVVMLLSFVGDSYLLILHIFHFCVISGFGGRFMYNSILC